MFSNYKSFILKRSLQNARQLHSSSIRKGYEGAGKTTLDIINYNEESQLLINNCSSAGFKLSDESLVIGSLAIFPKALLSWNIKSGNDINEASLSLFTVLYPPLDIIVLGLETNYEYKHVLQMKKILIKHNIKSEILPVQQACGIYNFLISEGRYVAAGLIPPLPKPKSTSEIN